jgi:iron complex transport system substrate-binding protein
MTAAGQSFIPALYSPIPRSNARMKIISLQPSVSIILDRLGCLDSLAACTKYCLEAVPALRDRSLPVVQDSWSTKAEELLPVPADLVIASVPYRQESLTAILRSGRSVLTLSPRNLADIYQDIRLIASVVGAAPKGEALVAEMQAEIEAVKARMAAISPKPLVYCEEWGKPLIHSQLWVMELVEAAGGEFIGTPGATTEAGAIAAADPDVIVAAWCGAGDRVPLERIVEQRQWQNLRAVRSSRVYCIADELLNTPAPTLIGGLHALAQAIHPDIFGSLQGPAGRKIA